MDFTGKKIYKCGDSLSKIYKCGEVVWEQSEIDYSKEYLTFEALESGPLVKPKAGDKLRLNGGEWVDNTGTIIVSAGDKVEFLGENSEGPGEGYFVFGDIGFNVYGNVNSIIYGEDFPNHNNDAAKIFRYLFRDSKVVNAGNLFLPATVTSQCYQSMFLNCASLTTTPALPATVLATQCYGSMFSGCKTLTTAPELPATTLATSCYFSMFSDCTSLTTAPELPATTLATRCYYAMFYGCTSLDYIKCLATDISASNSHSRWVTDVASSGTFVKKAGVEWTTGVNGIPNDWTVIEE